MWLLDTHVWIWSLLSPAKLGESFRASVAEPGRDVRLSVASAWEVAIKHATGKLSLASRPEEYVPHHMAMQGIAFQSIDPAHVLAVASLPMHHRDPFDRLLVAQARAIGATIVTTDPQIARYDVPVLDPTA